MLKRGGFYFFLLLVGLVVLPVQADIPSRVSVRLKKNLQRISLTGLNVHFQGRVPTFARAPFGSLIGLWQIERKNNEWHIHQTQGPVMRLKTEHLKIQGESLRVDVQSMPGTVVLLAQGSRHFSLLSDMDMDTYLSGVLPSEMPWEWPEEALKAQAVAARSYTLGRLRERQNKNTYLEATVLDQVFNWQTWENLPVEARDKIKKAVVETQGKVLHTKNAQPLMAYFHSDCGGTTEDSRRIWGGTASSGTAVDTFCPLNPLAKWTWRVQSAALVQQLQGPLRLSTETRLASLESVERSSTGRVLKIALNFVDGTQKIVSGERWRALLGFERVKSTQFEIRRQGEEWILEGRGYGHGVGLCQWGARALALRGVSFEKILHHYYPGAQLASASGNL